MNLQQPPAAREKCQIALIIWSGVIPLKSPSMQHASSVVKHAPDVIEGRELEGV